ncbi:MAG: SDR family oxidoreductase, partial [Limisphaerales bacterium]
HLKEGAAIINTTSIQAYEPSPHLMDYAGTKAAIMNFTRALAKEVADKKIRVKAVAPGPIWTSLTVTSFEGEDIKGFGQKTLLKRAGQPSELAPAYVFLAPEADSSFITGRFYTSMEGRGCLANAIGFRFAAQARPGRF